MERIIINKEIGTQVNNQLRQAYDYLINCEEIISHFKVLEDLGIDNGSNYILKSAINNLKKDIDVFSQTTNSYASELIYLDDLGGQSLDEE